MKKFLLISSLIVLQVLPYQVTEAQRRTREAIEKMLRPVSQFVLDLGDTSKRVKELTNTTLRDVGDENYSLGSDPQKKSLQHLVEQLKTIQTNLVTITENLEKLSY